VEYLKVAIWYSPNSNTMIKQQRHTVECMLIFIANFREIYAQISQRCNLPSQVMSLQYDCLHMILHFINFSRHSISFDRADGTGLLTETTVRL